MTDAARTFRSTQYQGGGHASGTPKGAVHYVPLPERTLA